MLLSFLLLEVVWCIYIGFHAGIKTNNGVQELNKLFKTYYNNLRMDKTLSGLCKVIVKPHHEEDIFVITRGQGGSEAEV